VPLPQMFITFISKCRIGFDPEFSHSAHSISGVFFFPTSVRQSLCEGISLGFPVSVGVTHIVVPNVSYGLFGCGTSYLTGGPRCANIAQSLGAGASPKVGELCPLYVFCLTNEAAFFQNPVRGPMVSVAECEQFSDLQGVPEACNCAQCFGCVAETPRFFRKYIAGHGSIRSLERESRTTQESSVFLIFDKVGAGRPPLPFFVTEI
jgi:hypothetical protein